MGKLYKLTDCNGRTYNGTQWGEGVTHSGTGEGELCGPGYIHAYGHPLLAVLLNPIHAGFANPRLWEAEGEIALRDGQLKCGCVTLTTIKEIPLPEVTSEMRVRFAILCAKKVCLDPAWNRWADTWLDGTDRTKEAAAWAEREAAAWAEREAEWEAAAAAWEAAEAAWAAAWEAAWEAAWTAAAAWAAAAAREAAAAASASAEATDKDIDFVAIAEEACGAINR